MGGSTSSTIPPFDFQRWRRQFAVAHLKDIVRDWQNPQPGPEEVLAAMRAAPVAPLQGEPFGVGMGAHLEVDPGLVPRTRRRQVEAPDRSSDPANPGANDRSVGTRSLGWTWQGRYWSSDDWGDEQIEVLNRAFEQINNNMDIIEDWEDEAGEETTCQQAILRGNSAYYGQAHIEGGTGVDVFGNGYAGRTVPGTTTTVLAKHFVKAMANARNFAQCDDDGTCSCPVAAVAGLIIHEVAHMCFQTENGAYSLGQFYMFRYAQDRGYSSEWCCARDWGDWNPWNYSTEEAKEASWQLTETFLTVKSGTPPWHDDDDAKWWPDTCVKASDMDQED